MFVKVLMSPLNRTADGAVRWCTWGKFSAKSRLSCMVHRVSYYQTHLASKLVRDHMNKIIYAIVTLALPMMAFAADPYKLSCEEKPESDLFQQSPHGAKRSSKHVLEIKYSAGVRKFVDKPPFDQFMTKV